MKSKSNVLEYLAEAAKQKDSDTELKDVDLTKLKIEGNSNSVISLLFTAGAKIERQDDGSYEIMCVHSSRISPIPSRNMMEPAVPKS